MVELRTAPVRHRLREARPARPAEPGGAVWRRTGLKWTPWARRSTIPGARSSPSRGAGGSQIEGTPRAGARGREARLTDGKGGLR